MDKPTLETLANHIRNEFHRIEVTPLLTRNDFIRPFRTHHINLDHKLRCEELKSFWERAIIVINPVSRFKPFNLMLREAFKN